MYQTQERQLSEANKHKKIKTIECRFAVYVPQPKGMWDAPDLHTVKEVVHFEDGTSEPYLHKIWDYQRPVWYSKKGQRRYDQHKEWEKIENLIEMKTTERDLVRNLARALEMRGFNRGKKVLFQEPYIYGADIKSTAVLKRGYMEKYKPEPTLFSICAFDIETDVVRGTGETIMASLTMKEKVKSFVLRIALPDVTDVEGRIKTLNTKYLGEFEKERNLQCELVICETEIDLYIEVFKTVHEWRPDFLAIWNMDFEIPKILEACDRVGYNPAHLFCDPSIPDEYKFYEYIQGKPTKNTASGKSMPVKPAARWHTLRAPASFYVIDSMCAFKHTRAGMPERQSYGLDAILGEEFDGKDGGRKIQKLKFEEASQYEGLKWHVFMQTYHPLEYLIYNRFDCISLEILDEKVMDVSVQIQKFSGTSDFEDFKSQPRRAVDNLHWFVKERGWIMGVTSSSVVDEFDDETLDRKDWIITLPAELIVDGGLQIIEEYGFHRTTIFGHVGDLDVSASYPNGEVCFNISKVTTSCEIIEIEGVEEEVFRMQNMGLSAGHVNAVDYGVKMMGFPTLPELDAHFTAHLQKKNAPLQLEHQPAEILSMPDFGRLPQKVDVSTGRNLF